MKTHLWYDNEQDSIPSASVLRKKNVSVAQYRVSGDQGIATVKVLLVFIEVNIYKTLKLNLPVIMEVWEGALCRFKVV